MTELNDVIPQSCILFATADWDEPYWTNKQHCAKSLAELGIRVLYVESIGLRSPKARSTKDWGRLWKRLRSGISSLIFGACERSPGIYVLSPLIFPAGHRYSLTRMINRFLFRVVIARACRKRKLLKPLIWTYHPFMLDIIDGMKNGPLLYHCVDDLAAVPGIDETRFRFAEQALLQRADIVFATAPALAEQCHLTNPNTYYMPNVVDTEHFGQALKQGPIPDDLSGIPEPRLCYHGVLSDFKINFQLLLDAVRLKPEWSWVFIGEEREGQSSAFVAELKRLPNAYFLGYRPYCDLPNYLRGIKVGLLPSLLNEYTAGMFPMKYFEYLAAGLPVASTPLDFIRDRSEGIEIGSSASDFCDAICRQMARGRFTIAEAARLVGNNTWMGRTRGMLMKLPIS